ncbi:MAG: undecaprenyl-phosphate glucose phosphotransferase [Rhodospirillales bacterium]|nr:undecaprenyl-phosphate glucose phosphotransferase [Rhodospirillales bacterium]
MPPLLPGLLRAADTACLAMAAAGGIAHAARLSPDLDRADVLLALLGTLAGINLLQASGAYRPASIVSLNAGLGRCLLAAAIAAGLIASAMTLLRPGWLAGAQDWLLAWLILSLLLLAAVRLGTTVWLRQWHASGRHRRRIAVIGAEAIGQQLLRCLHGHGEDIEIVGVYDDRKDRLPHRCMGHAIAGGIDTLVDDIRHRAVDQVVIALPLAAERRILDVLQALRQAPVDILLCPDLAGLRLKKLSARQVGDAPLLVAVERPLKAWNGVAKALLDRLLAAAILVAIAPLMLLIAALIKLDSAGPVLFRQRRYGLNNEMIEVFKFRTMRSDAADRNAERLTVRNDPRVTRVGAFLRRTSLDELPQFLNVLRGDMSVVGPRPHATAAKAGGLLYPEAVRGYHARHRVKPGITGWAQVNGWRGETETVEQIARRVEHDLYYIEHWTVAFDLWIVARTIFGGFAGRNAY